MVNLAGVPILLKSMRANIAHGLSCISSILIDTQGSIIRRSGRLIKRSRRPRTRPSRSIAPSASSALTLGTRSIPIAQGTTELRRRPIQVSSRRDGSAATAASHSTSIKTYSNTCEWTAPRNRARSPKPTSRTPLPGLPWMMSQAQAVSVLIC